MPIKNPATVSQYLSIESVALSATVWPQVQCQVMTPNSTPIREVRVDLGDREWYQSKSSPDIPIRLPYTL